MVYKSINDLAPDYLSENVKSNSPCSRMKNFVNTANDLQVPITNKCNGQRAFSFRRASVWNQLDSQVMQTSSFKAFKKAVRKTVYVDVSFYL